MFGCETSISDETEILRVDGRGGTSTIKTSSFKAYDRGYRVTWNSLQGAYFTPAAALASIQSASPTSLDQNVYVTMCTDGSLETSVKGGGAKRVVLSPGAIAGIVVGALVVIFVGVGILAFCLVKKRRRARQNPPIQQVPPQQSISRPIAGGFKMQDVKHISSSAIQGNTGMPMTHPGGHPTGGWQGQHELQGYQNAEGHGRLQRNEDFLGSPGSQMHHELQVSQDIPGTPAPVHELGNIR